MEAIKETFAQCKREGRTALVTYVTAGYPTLEDTVDILLGMEAGGAGMIWPAPNGIAYIANVWET
jgi:tryptophan synthase